MYDSLLTHWLQQAGLPNPSKFISIESVMTSNHLILCCPRLLLPSIVSSSRVFYNKSALRISWTKYWSSKISTSPSNVYSVLISSEWTSLISFQSKELSRVFSNTTVQKLQFFGTQIFLIVQLSHTHIYDYWKNHSFD